MQHTAASLPSVLLSEGQSILVSAGSVQLGVVKKTLKDITFFLFTFFFLQCKGKDSGGHRSGGLHPLAGCQQPGAQPAGEWR